MKRFAAALAVALTAGPTAADDAKIRAFCLDSWGENYSLRELCENSEKSGRAKVEALLADPPPEAGPAFAQCLDTWANSYSLQALCFDHQTDALEDLARLRAEGDEIVTGTIIPNCARTWGDNPALLVLCVEHQIDARRRLGE